MPITQIPIRLRLTTDSNPAAEPIDQNTGRAPSAYRANTIGMALGFFGTDAEPANIAGLSYLQVILQASEDATEALVVKQVDAINIIDLITTAGWNDGSAQNAAVVFTSAEMDQSLGAQSQKALWIVVVGYTPDGAPLIFGAGDFVLHNGSLALPVIAPKYVSLHKQTTNTADVTVTPETQLHTEVIAVGGVARTSLVLLDIPVGLNAGAKLTLVISLPATPGIVLHVKNELSGNPTISTWETDGLTRALLWEYYYDLENDVWTPEAYLTDPV